MKKTLLEIAKEKGLIELKESFSVIFEKKDIEILETTQLFESGGKEYKSIGVLKQVPITKYKINLNNRIYESELWKKVKEKNMVEGSLALADHPKGNEEGSVKDIIGIWRNFTVNETTANADLYLVGDLGKNLLELVRLGGKAGFSTAGYGSLKEDNKTVDPNSYVYERCDWILNPSQQVYATTENIKESSDPIETPKTDEKPSKLPESVIKSVEKVNIIENDTTNKCEDKVLTDIIQENKSNEVITMDKIQEAQFRNTINDQVSKAKKNENLFEAVNDLKGLDTADSHELKEKVESTIQGIQSKIAEKEASLVKQLNESNSALTQITADHTTVVAVADELKEKLSKVSSFIEQIVDTQEDFDSSVFVENYNLLTADHEKITLMLENENFKAYEVKTLDDFVTLMEDRMTWEKDITDLQEQLAKSSTNEKLEAAETHIKECETLLEGFGYKFEEKKAVKEEDGEEDDTEKKPFPPKKDDTEDKKKDDEEEIPVEEKKAKKSSKKESAFVPYSVFGDNTILTEADDSEEEDDDEEDDEEMPVEEKKAKKSKKKESVTVSNEIAVFFEKQCTKFPGIKDFKKEIMESGSLLEAFEIVENIKSNPEEIVNYVQTNVTQRPSWMGKGMK